MTLKTFTSKAPIQFEYNGETIDLPGELSILAQLKMVELEEMNGSDAEVTMNDMMELFRAMLGSQTAEKLFALGVGLTTLNEILDWYMQKLTEVKPQDHKSPNVRKATVKTK